MATQVNVRLDETLLNEIVILTKVLHVSRTEWLRMKIALAVKKDTLNLRESVALEYAKGRISDKEPARRRCRRCKIHCRTSEERKDRTG